MGLFISDPRPPKVPDPSLPWYLQEADDIADKIVMYEFQGRKCQLEVLNHILNRVRERAKMQSDSANEEANYKAEKLQAIVRMQTDLNCSE